MSLDPKPIVAKIRASEEPLRALAEVHQIFGPETWLAVLGEFKAQEKQATMESIGGAL